MVGIDYELIEREQWLTAPGARTRPERRVVQTLVAQPDTTGRTAWRARKDADGKIRLPQDFAPFEQAEMKARAGDETALTRNFPQLAQIAASHDVEIMIGQASSGYKSNSRTSDLVVYFWGKSEDVIVAIALVEEWIKDIHGKNPKKREKWVKLPSLTAKEKQVRFLALEAENQQREFCKQPPQNTHFPCMASFTWPSDSIRPQEVLGMSYEALDAVRMETSSYIICDPKTGNFRILGNSTKSTHAAVMKLRNTFFTVLAHQADMSTHYFVAPQTERSRSVIKLVEFVPPQASASGRHRSPVADRLPKLETDIPDPEMVNAKFTKKMRQIILQSLGSLTNWHGNLTMRVRLGQFILSKWKKLRDDSNSMSRDDFDAMMDDPNVMGEVLDSCPAFERLITKEALIAGTFPPGDSLQEIQMTDVGVKPNLLATILVRETTGQMLRLDVEFTSTSDGKYYDCTMKQWSRVAQDDGEATQLLEIMRIDLDDNIAWDLEITATSLLPSPPPANLDKFASSIQVLSTPSAATGLLVTFKPESALRLVSIRQAEVFKYRFNHSAYTCDISLVQDFKVENVGSLLAPKFSCLPPRWTVSVGSDIWAGKFAENADAKTGGEVGWKATAPAFFPGDEGLRGWSTGGEEVDGFGDFMIRLAEVQSLFAGVA